MTVKQKLQLSLSFLTALVAIVGLSMLVMQQRVTNTLLYLTEESAPAVIALEQLTMNASRMQGEALSHALLVVVEHALDHPEQAVRVEETSHTHESSGLQAENELNEFFRARNQLQTWLTRYSEHAERNEEADEQMLAARLQEKMRIFVSACEALLQLGTGSSEARFQAAWQTLEEAEDEFLETVNEAVSVEVGEFDVARALATAQAARMRFVNIGAIFWP